MLVGAAVGLLLRAALHAAGAVELIGEEQLEFVTPITSFLGLKECHFLSELGTSPYAGSVCHVPPLLLSLLQPLLALKSATAVYIFVSLMDLGVAFLLRRIAQQYAEARLRAGLAWLETSFRLPKPRALLEELASQRKTEVPKEDPNASQRSSRFEVSPDFVGLFYLLNPLVVASGLALSLQNIRHLLICLALASAGAGGTLGTILALTSLFYVVPWGPIVLVLPCAWLAWCQSSDLEQKTQYGSFSYVRSREQVLLTWPFFWYCIFFTSLIILALAGLLFSSSVITGDWLFLDACYAYVLEVRDLTPNVGMFWYLFIEVFDRFRNMFLFILQAHLLFYPVPLYLKLGRHRPTGPWLATIACLGILVMFQPYPTASDFALMVAALLTSAEVVKECETAFVFFISGMLFGVAMFPSMRAVWLTRNAGNSNYLYNMTLVINVFGGLMLSEWVRGAMRLRRRTSSIAYCREVVLSAVEDVFRKPKTEEKGEEVS